jgi:prepilin-type N-terminal cleavage/methylation domain-containing protein
MFGVKLQQTQKGSRMILPHRSRGFTLLELLVTLAVLTVILSISAGFSRDMTESAERQASLSSFFRGFQTARSEAIKRGHIMTICPLSEGGVCTSDWTTPVAIFTDPHNSRALSPGEQVVQWVKPPKRGKLIPAPATRRYFQFDAIGAAHGTIGNVTYCPLSEEPTLVGQIILNMGGRVMYAVDYNGDGIVQKSNGTPVTCP